MELTCPKCSKPLPEVETLEFRFCPHCGAKITAEVQQLEDGYLTIPPDPPSPKTDQQPMDLHPQTEDKITIPGQLNDQTIEPQPMAGLQKPKLKPPDTPPPVSFFRPRSDEKPSLTHSTEKVLPKSDQKKQSPTKNRKIVITVLVILAIIILLLGALFTF